MLRQKLKYALNGREVTTIVNDKEGTIKVDQKIRRDEKYPLGLNGLFSILLLLYRHFINLKDRRKLPYHV